LGYIELDQYEREVNSMLDTRTLALLAPRAGENLDREATQMADLRASQRQDNSRSRSAFERIQALLGRTQAPSSANCDCTE
jgi:hypothetical protein